MSDISDIDIVLDPTATTDASIDFSDGEDDNTEVIVTQETEVLIERHLDGVAIPGPAGPIGPQGPAGDDATPAVIAADITVMQPAILGPDGDGLYRWEITHGLDFEPNATFWLKDAFDVWEPVEPARVTRSPGVVTAYWTVLVPGRAIFS